MDAEGSFNVSVIKKDYTKYGYAVIVSFEIALNKNDKNLLELVKEVLCLENKIYYNKNDDTFKLKVSNIDEFIKKIIPHFKEYTLFTQKRIDFLLICKVIYIINNKKHLTLDGLNEIISLKGAINLGLSESLKEEFFNVKLVERQIIDFGMPNFYWLSGFIEGEACFYVSVYNSQKSKLNFAVQLVFKITQHIRDKNMLDNISKLLDCGRVEIRKSQDACDFVITSFSEFKNYMIPFLNKYPLKGKKLQDCKDFYKVYEIMVTKGHLTRDGLTLIKKIKDGMNTKRI